MIVDLDIHTEARIEQKNHWQLQWEWQYSYNGSGSGKEAGAVDMVWISF